MSNAHILFTLAAVVLVGCESPQDKSMNAEEARVAADQKVAEVTQATREKEAEIRQRADEESARVGRDGAKKLDEAEAVAQAKEAEAVDALAKARGQVRDAASARLLRLDKQIIDLHPKLERRLRSTDAADVMANLRTRAEAVKSAITDLDVSTADNLDTFKRTIDNRFDELEQAISSAKKRL